MNWYKISQLENSYNMAQKAAIMFNHTNIEPQHIADEIDFLKEINATLDEGSSFYEINFIDNSQIFWQNGKWIVKNAR